MGASPQPIFSNSLHLKGMDLEDKDKCNKSNVLGTDAKRRWQGRRRPRRILMKKRVFLEPSRRPENGVEKRVRTLKKLVPNSGEAAGLDGLFREAADYIISLQIRVQAMQTMVKMLSGSDE